MQHNVSLIAAVIFGTVTSIFLVLAFFFNVKPDPKEPPYIPQTIPYIGHLIEVIRKGTKYYEQISAKYPFPAYSLGMPGGRMYIINSPDLVIAVQRNAKWMMSSPFTAKFAAPAFDLSKEAKTIWFDNIDQLKGDWGLNYDGMRAIHDALTLGSTDLDQMNRVMLQAMTASFANLAPGRAEKKIRLMEWVRSELTTAATFALYGPMNPFEDKKVQHGFWDFLNNFTMLLVNIMPHMTVSVGYKGRQRVFDAIEYYLRNGGLENESSGLVRARCNANRKYNIPTRDIAHFEIGNAVAAVVNTTPATFWNLYHIYSDPSLLQKVRTEVETALTTTTDTAGFPCRQLNVTKLRTACPLINSVFQEVLRFRSANASVRLVLKDLILQDRHLLKKGSVVHMPSRVIHYDTSVWGPNAREFVADRFVHVQQPSTKIHPGAFRAFGGGNTLCPGRHFATTTILAIVAMFVLRYDAQPASGDGKWTNLTQEINNLVPVILPPDEDILLEIRSREGFEDWEWEFVGVESKTHFPLAGTE